MPEVGHSSLRHLCGIAQGDVNNVCPSSMMRTDRDSFWEGKRNTWRTSNKNMELAKIQLLRYAYEGIIVDFRVARSASWPLQKLRRLVMIYGGAKSGSPGFIWLLFLHDHKADKALVGKTCAISKASKNCMCLLDKNLFTVAESLIDISLLKISRDSQRKKSITTFGRDTCSKRDIGSSW